MTEKFTNGKDASFLTLCVLCASVASVFIFCFAAGTRAQQVDPASLPARESHEGLLIAVDPYADAARSQARFGKKHPYAAGLLAVEVFFRNDTTRPIRMDLGAIRLLLSPAEQSRQRLEPLDIEQVIEKILHKEKGGPEVTRPRTPVPIPRRAPDRSKEWKEVEAVLKPLALEMDILPPQSNVHGFLFFDLARHFDWVADARLYVPSLKFMDTNQELFFFEVDLGKAARK